jgi:hypothetical protein
LIEAGDLNPPKFVKFIPFPFTLSPFPFTLSPFPFPPPSQLGY